MNGTPTLRSAFPATPPSSRRPRSANLSPTKQSHVSAKPSQYANQQESVPVIPFSLVDAPSQRLYVSLLYVGLFAWRAYDFLSLPSDGTDGFLLFTKWVGIDTAFLYGLSGLNIPWLQWSSSTFTALFILHAVLDWMLMFQIPIPIFAWLGAFSKVVYDREYAVSERYVKPGSILHNSSVILGKQIIHILPEGSATLNPNRIAFCISEDETTAALPLEVNQTTPILLELTRTDLDTSLQEPITVSSKELKRLRKIAQREVGKIRPNDPLTLHYTVRQTGLYRLHTVIDESNLEVRRRPSYALVVQCPSASIKQVPRDKCTGDLSDFSLVVEGTPPMKIKYSKTINQESHGHTTLSIQPNDLSSPLGSRSLGEMVVPQERSSEIDVMWARTQVIPIPLNESLGIPGGWQYTIDEVHDACGNKANYSDTTSSPRSYGIRKTKELEQHFFVHERPAFSLRGYDTQSPIKVERGHSKILPVRFNPLSSSHAGDELFKVRYLFTPEGDVLPDQRHPTSAQLYEVTIDGNQHGTGGIEVREPGLYSLDSVSSVFCRGDILEPSTCQLINPVEPDLSVNAKAIPDRCAGSSIGLTVDLDLTGTPPFRVFYKIRSSGSSVIPKVQQVDRYHTQLELRPSSAGLYTYEFDRISDSVYSDPRPLSSKSLKFVVDVKPPAFASFSHPVSAYKACIGEPQIFGVSLSGNPPFALEYELVHRGRREKHVRKEISEFNTNIETDPLHQGGEYALTLTSVTDATGCKQALDAEVKIDVGLQRPRASFAQIEGQRRISSREGERAGLPVRLQGKPPFRLQIRRTDDSNGKITLFTTSNANDDIHVLDQGIYELVDVQDANCPGSIDVAAKDFAVNWIARPSVALSESPLVLYDKLETEKRSVCEGDEDMTDLNFDGSPPYDVQYEVRFKPDRGPQSTSRKSFTAGLDTASIKMDTSNAGLYTYQISKLGDASYGHDKGKFNPLLFQQRVHARPHATFTEVGKTYKYCKEADNIEDVIPVELTGVPPFQLQIEIRHHLSAKPESISVPNVESNRYELRIPNRALALGSHTVTIRMVEDSRGCRRIMDYNAPYVIANVADVPSILPLEEDVDFCVGDRISYLLSGTPPFNVYYTFQDHERKAKVPSTDFRRIAEQPGDFVITAVSDSRSTDACRSKIEIAKTIHEMPSVRVSKGKTAIVDIHEGGEAEILFEFGGTPPFYFTYTRSTTPVKGKKTILLETKQEVSYEHRMVIRASDEGLYEVVAIRDKFCSFSVQQNQLRSA